MAIISDFGREIETNRLVLEGSAGEAVCLGGERRGVMLPEFEDFAGEHSVKGLSRRSEGGGGSMGYRLFRRLLICELYAHDHMAIW